MSVPKLRFKEFKGEWEVKKLEELLLFKNGINASKEQYGKGVKFINVMDIINNDFITYDNIIGCVDVTEKVFEESKVEYGDVLFQRSSETREEVGQASVYLDKNKSATFGGFVIRGKKIGEYNPIFINFLLKTDLIRKDITDKSGGSTRYNIGQDALKAVVIHLPSIQEQTKIADFLITIDEKIAQLTQKCELLARYKKGVMQQLFSQQLRFKDDDGCDFPDWEEKKIINFAPLQRGFDLPVNTIIEGEFPVVFSNGILKRHNQYKVAAPGVVTGRSGTIGNVTYVEKNYWPHNTALWVTDFKNNLPKFVYYFYIDFDLSRLSSGSGVPTLNRNDVHSQIIYVPISIKEQTKIANFLTTLDEKITQSQTYLETVKQYKQGLLQQMFI